MPRHYYARLWVNRRTVSPAIDANHYAFLSRAARDAFVAEQDQRGHDGLPLGINQPREAALASDPDIRASVRASLVHHGDLRMLLPAR